VRFLATLVLLAASAAPASAQIYSWRDAEGLLVVSDRPRIDQGEMTTYTVPRSTAVRATAPAAGSARPSVFDEVIEEQATAHGVAPELVRAVIQVESGFNTLAVSDKGAMGLMQLMPATARELGVSNPFHAEENIRGGVAYLRQLLDRYDSNVELALAAYNAGPGSVARYGGAVPPYRETQAYVKKVTKVSGPSAPVKPPTIIYKWVDLVNGQPVTRYSNKPPEGVAAELVARTK
jgi:soluble lytic murein transglycosylase-like protein